MVDPFLEMDPEQLEKLETALQSEQAKQILGENVTAMLGKGELHNGCACPVKLDGKTLTE